MSCPSIDKTNGKFVSDEKRASAHLVFSEVESARSIVDLGSEVIL